MVSTHLEIYLALFCVLTIPLFLHYVYFGSGSKSRPSILILGPSDSGKTSLLILLESGKSGATHTSQTPISVEVSLPSERVAGQDKYRSVNDPLSQTDKKFTLIDTPGHGKLRHYALKNLTDSSMKGIIFVVDAASLATSQENLRRTADYLYDVLLLLQKQSGQRKDKTEFPFLIAANKMDLFTAMPVPLVKKNLESEITKIRDSRSKGLLDSGMGAGDGSDEETDDWLGEMGSKQFNFSQMCEHDIVVEIHGGNVIGEEPSIQNWWSWISERL